MKPKAVGIALALSKEIDRLAVMEFESLPADASQLTTLAWELTDEFDYDMGFTVQEEEGGLWMAADESTNISAVVAFVQTVMELAPEDTEDLYSFSWAETCSKPRVDAFGGGCVVFTRDQDRWLDASLWAASTTAELLCASREMAHG